MPHGGESAGAPAAELGLPADCVTKILGWLGGGSYGEVWHCRYRPLVGAARAAEAGDAAVKLLKKSVADLTEDELTWLEREASNQSILDHDNVCKLYEVGLAAPTDGGPERVFLVLELASAQTLGAYLRQHGPRVPEAAKRVFFIQMMLGLQHCHAKGVYNRDVKPDNCLLTAKLEVKVADFGFSKSPFAGQGDLATAVGTGPYRAPEMDRGGRYDGEKADVFSCGVTLYEMIFGALPFLHHPSTGAPLDLSSRAGRTLLFENKHRRPLAFPGEGEGEPPSPELKDLLEAMLQPNPEQRLGVEQVLAHPWSLELPPQLRRALGAEAESAGRLSQQTRQAAELCHQAPAPSLPCHTPASSAAPPLLCGGDLGGNPPDAKARVAAALAAIRRRRDELRDAASWECWCAA